MNHLVNQVADYVSLHFVKVQTGSFKGSQFKGFWAQRPCYIRLLGHFEPSR